MLPILSDKLCGLWILPCGRRKFSCDTTMIFIPRQQKLTPSPDTGECEGCICTTEPLWSSKGVLEKKNTSTRRPGQFANKK